MDPPPKADNHPLDDVAQSRDLKLGQVVHFIPFRLLSTFFLHALQPLLQRQMLDKRPKIAKVLIPESAGLVRTAARDE